eukprot:COSAG05_NODE_7992_length_748_cov_1.041602_1_plen_94_part_10
MAMVVCSHMVLHQEEAGVENLGAHAFTVDPTCVAGWALSSPRPSHAYGTSSGAIHTHTCKRERESESPGLHPWIAGSADQNHVLGVRGGIILTH